MNFRILLISFILVFFTISCSVQDRLYRPGKNIEWNYSRKHLSKNNKELHRYIHVTQHQICQDTPAINQNDELIASSEKIYIPEEYFSKNRISKLQTPKILNTVTPGHIEQKPFDDTIKSEFNNIYSKNISEEKEQKTVHWGSIMSLVMGIVSITTFFGIITAPLAIIFSIVALIKIIYHHDKYKGIVMAVIGLLLGILGLFLIPLMLSIIFP